MMHERGKSDSPIVPEKPPNKPRNRLRRRGREGGWPRGTRSRAPRAGRSAGMACPSALERVRQAAQQDRKQRFTALLHHVYAIERLRAAYEGLNPRAAAGIDGETWQHYGQNLEANLQDLSGRLKRGAYRAQPVRQSVHPEGGRAARPLGVPALEDKLVQRAVVEVLNAIYDTDFLGFSYGFRPGRSPHDALGRALDGAPDAEGELGARCRHPELFRHARPWMAGQVHRAPRRRTGASCGSSRSG